MKNKYILSPYYLDEEVLGLYNLLQADWSLNKPELHQGDAQDRMATIQELLAEMVYNALQNGKRPVSIAGDCCSSIGVLAGIQRAGINPFLIWFDAHGDFNTWETTPSGFLGGMPLAMLVGRGEQRMPVAVDLVNIAEEDVILTDARDLDPGEKISLDHSRVSHLSKIDQVLEYGLPDRPIYVHFDTDVIDPLDAPAMNYLAPGGPRAGQVKAVFQHLASNHQIVAASLSSWNPELDQDGKTQKICLDAFNELINN